MSKRNRTAVNYARHRMIDARDLLSEAIRTLESKAGPGDPDTVTITISRETAERWLRHRDDACTSDNCTASDCVVERAFRAALEGEQ